MSKQVFGWQGFRFEHPEDWAPVTLSGNRNSGYVRLASSGRVGCQVRWQRSRPLKELKPKLEAYFARLRRDAQKRKAHFETDFDERDGKLEYRWRGEGQARGALFSSLPCSRVFFAEVVGGRNDSLLTPAKELLDSFSSESEGRLELWSLFGLALRLPAGLVLEKTLLRSGHTRLVFRKGRARIECERWAFAEQLIQKHGLEEWARAVLTLKRALVKVEPDGIAFESSGRLSAPTTALVRHQAERNQIVTVKGTRTKKLLSPRWEWILSAEPAFERVLSPI